MEKVVNRLSEIEAAAAAIIDSANTAKKEISDAMDQRIAAFDKTVDAETAQTLSDLTKQLQAETEQELSALKEQTQQSLDALEDEYNKNHTALAKQILNKIIGA